MHRTTITQARELLHTKKLSSVELTEAVFARIDAVEDKVKAFAHLMRKKAIEQAKTADARIAKGEDLPLLGVPIALKDLICTQGSRTSCASKILDHEKSIKNFQRNSAKIVRIVEES